MATAEFEVPAGNLRGDTTSTVNIADVADTNSRKIVAQFPNATSRAHGSFYFPANYLSGTVVPKLRIRSKSGSATQTKAFGGQYVFRNSGDDPSGTGSSMT